MFTDHPAIGREATLVALVGVGICMSCGHLPSVRVDNAHAVPTVDSLRGEPHVWIERDDARGFVGATLTLTDDVEDDGFGDNRDWVANTGPWRVRYRQDVGRFARRFDARELVSIDFDVTTRLQRTRETRPMSISPSVLPVGARDAPPTAFRWSLFTPFASYIIVVADTLTFDLASVSPTAPLLAVVALSGAEKSSSARGVHPLACEAPIAIRLAELAPQPAECERCYRIVGTWRVSNEYGWSHRCGTSPRPTADRYGTPFDVLAARYITPRALAVTPMTALEALTVAEDGLIVRTIAREVWVRGARRAGRVSPLYFGAMCGLL